VTVIRNVPIFEGVGLGALEKIQPHEPKFLSSYHFKNITTTMTRIAAETATAEPPAIHTITRLAQVLDTGLDQKAIESIVALLENGVHPDALAALIIEIRRAGSAGTIGK